MPKLNLTCYFMSDGANLPELPFDPTNLPISQLESLRFKANQIIESIQTLQRTIDGHPTAIPAWPDILSKYNVLLSQTHNFSTSLVNPVTGVRVNGAVTPKENLLEKVALHPSVGMTDAQLDNEVIPLLRNQQTVDVLKVENESVRRMSEHMATGGSMGVLTGTFPAFSSGRAGRKPENEDVLIECAEIREAHDRRVERAVRAVTMLRDKFDWKTRVEVEVEEPEELTWDPRLENEDPDASEGDDDEDDDSDSADTPQPAEQIPTPASTEMVTD